MIGGGLQEHRAVDIRPQRGEFGSQRIGRYAAAMLGGLPDVTRQYIGLIRRGPHSDSPRAIRLASSISSQVK